MPEQLRRSSRIRKEVPILLVGSDMEGRVFSERTKTVVLSRHGAGIVSQYTLSAEQEVILRMEDSNREAEVRVVGQLALVDGKYIYGVAFLDPKLNFWEMEFPPMSDAEKEASRRLLECSSCKGRETVDQSDVEADVFTINQGVVRYCKRCGSSTMWKLASGEAEPERAKPAAALVESPVAQPPDPQASETLERVAPFADDPLPVTAPVSRSHAARTQPAVDGTQASAQPATPSRQTTGTPGARRENRRKHVRTKVNFKGCVRYQGSDDIVACEDISRGGVRLKSSKRYNEKAMIEVAVPYEPGTPSIFVPAQIVYVQELPSGKFRYGVAYVSSGH